MKEIPLSARMVVAAPSGDSLRAGSVVEFMAMPAGRHVCNFGQGGELARREILVTAASARALNEQLAAVNGRSAHRAYFDFDHKDEIASAWPRQYLWRETPEAGVYCRAELSGAGAEAIGARNYRAFSQVC